MNNKSKFLVLPILSFFLLSCTSVAVEEEKKEEVPVQTSNNNQNNNQGDTNNNETNNNNNTPEGSDHVEVMANPMDEPYVARQYYLNHIGDIYSVWNQYLPRIRTVSVG